MKKILTTGLALVIGLALTGCATRKVERTDAPGYGRVPGTGLEYFCDPEHGNLIYFSDPSGSDVEYEWLVWGGCNGNRPENPTVIPDNP